MRVVDTFRVRRRSAREASARHLALVLYVPKLHKRYWRSTLPDSFLASDTVLLCLAIVASLDVEEALAGNIESRRFCTCEISWRFFWIRLAGEQSGYQGTDNQGKNKL